MTGIDAAVRSFFTLARLPHEMASRGEYTFSFTIDPGSFLEIKPEEVFEGVLPADLIAETIEVKAQLLTSSSPNSFLPDSSAALFCELPVGAFNDKDGAMLACALNELNADGIMAGALFMDVSDTAVYYRQLVDTSISDSNDGRLRAITNLYHRAHSELTYALQGLIIFRRKLGEEREKVRQAHTGKIITLFPPGSDRH